MAANDQPRRDIILAAAQRSDFLLARALAGLLSHQLEKLLIGF
jgi:hypothetical protein